MNGEANTFWASTSYSRTVLLSPEGRIGRASVMYERPVGKNDVKAG